MEKDIGRNNVDRLDTQVTFLHQHVANLSQEVLTILNITLTTMVTQPHPPEGLVAYPSIGGVYEMCTLTTSEENCTQYHTDYSFFAFSGRNLKTYT